jgi:hypothetical protein
LSVQIAGLKELSPRVLATLDMAFAAFEQQLPCPVRINKNYGFVYRYIERSIEQAIILKFARANSSLRGALLLLENGYVQEQSVIQRVLDEIHEDILFLVFGISIDSVTELHRRYLEAFFEKKFNENGNAIASKQRRPMIPRRKIRAYLSRVEDGGLNPSEADKLSRTISKTYSGYVHAAAPHIFGMYGGVPPRFYCSGMLGTERIQEHAEDLKNYFYRGMLSGLGAAYAFQDDIQAKQIRDCLNWFKRKAGMNFRSA